MRIKLAEKCPELASEWSEKNHPLMPDMVTYGSDRKVWWKGRCGHEWEAVIKNRVHGAGCPVCSGNRVMKGINDLATVRPDLVREWSERNKNASPYDVSAYSNRRVWWRCARGHEWPARVADRSEGHGCPYCCGNTFQSGVNDLQTMYPDIAAFWSPRNRLLKPSDVSPRSMDKAWWKCPDCGYEWERAICRMADGIGCPVCNGSRTVTGINDLATTDPQLAGEWNWERNERTPYDVPRGSLYTVWWKGRCGHEWRARVKDRAVKKEGCPICEAGYLASLGKLLVMYYAGKTDQRILLDDVKTIGLGLQTYLPEISLALEFAQNPVKEEKRVQTIKDYMCRIKRIKLVNITGWKNEMELAEMVKEAFCSSNIFIKTDTEDDLAIVRNRYFTWLERSR